MKTNTLGSAFIVFFLAFLYFEVPARNSTSMNNDERQVLWLLSHFPFVVGVILLMTG